MKKNFIKILKISEALIIFKKWSIKSIKLFLRVESSFKEFLRHHFLRLDIFILKVIIRVLFFIVLIMSKQVHFLYLLLVLIRHSQSILIKWDIGINKMLIIVLDLQNIRFNNIFILLASSFVLDAHFCVHMTDVAESCGYQLLELRALELQVFHQNLCLSQVQYVVVWHYVVAYRTFKCALCNFVQVVAPEVCEFIMRTISSSCRIDYQDFSAPQRKC